MKPDDKIKRLLFRHLQQENAFWSYDPKSVSMESIDDDTLIEKVLLHLDIEDINRLFSGYPKNKIKNVWKTRLCPLEPYYNRLNRLYAYMYFDIKNPDRYIKLQNAKHFRKLVK